MRTAPSIWVGMVGAMAFALPAPAAALPAPVAGGAKAKPARQKSIVVRDTRRLVLRTASRARELVATRATPEGCGRAGARLRVQVGGRTVTARVRQARKLRIAVPVTAGDHAVALRVRPRGRCRVSLRRLRFTPGRAPAPPADFARVPRRPVPVAAAVDRRQEHAWYDLAYPGAFVGHFDGLTVENVMKMEYTWPGERRFDFRRADAVVSLAASNGRSVHGHALIWHRQLPKWLWGRGWRPEELGPKVRSFFGLMLGRYKGRVQEWDVVNEPLSDDGSGLRESFWLTVFGPSYVEQAFRWADAADPDARLFLNEYGIEEPSAKSDRLLALLRDLLQRGTPIDGVGFQFHMDVTHPLTDRQVYDQLRRFADLGLEVQITEMDVAVPPAFRNDPATLERQAAQFQAVARACNALEACTRFTTWGVSDRYTWRGAATVPLLLDANYAPKQAYRLVREAFAPVR